MQQSTSFELLNSFYINEAYKLAVQFVDKNWLGTFVVAECLVKLNKARESIPLFGSFLQHNEMSGKDYAVDYAICRSNLSLTKIYEASGDTAKHCFYLNQTIECYNKIQPLSCRYEALLLPMRIELNQKGNRRREYLLCKRRLYELSRQQILPCW